MNEQRNSSLRAILIIMKFVMLCYIIIIIITALQPFIAPWPLFSGSRSYTPSAVLLGREISPLQRLYLYIEQQKLRINTHNTGIHALSGIRTHDPSFRAVKNSHVLECAAMPSACFFYIMGLPLKHLHEIGCSIFERIH
jgi:hypothetical protein